MQALQIDHARHLYVESHVGYTASVDFSTVLATANALAGHLGIPTMGIGESEIGTQSAFEKYQRLMRLAMMKIRPGEVWYDPRTPRDARIALDTARASKRKVRLHYGDPNTGLDKLATQDIVGFVGYAGWQLPHPILLSERNCHLGSRICELEVVRVVDVDGMFASYEHPRYTLPAFTTVSANNSEAPDEVMLIADGSPVMNCTNQGQATRWIKFFKGSTHTPPKFLI